MGADGFVGQTTLWKTANGVNCFKKLIKIYPWGHMISRLGRLLLDFRGELVESITWGRAAGSGQARPYPRFSLPPFERELELTQTHTIQKTMLRVERGKSPCLDSLSLNDSTILL
jgi:hypothetical protein